MSLSSLRVLVVGVGGLGCPAAWALAEAGVGTLWLADDDEIDVSNLHRQILFGPADVGRDKVATAVAALSTRYPALSVRGHATRFLPSVAAELLDGVDVVVEGADNFATKFLVADACALARKPVVHGAALRWLGTALAVGAVGRPCYRCVFEDLPPGPAPSCADAGVMGPVCGVVGALMADLALRLVAPDLAGPDGAGRPGSAAGTLVSFDGKRLTRRTTRVASRAGCELCGEGAVAPPLVASRYAS